MSQSGRNTIAPLTIAVNVSAKQFTQHGIEPVIHNPLRTYAVEPHLLQIELTEWAAIQRPEETVAELENVKALGVSIAMENVGMGHASLSYLTRLPLDVLKIDKAFVAGLPADEHDASVTKTIIAMGHGLGLKVIAEGVEHEKQAAFLAENGCDEMQGFLLGRPVPAWEMTGIARERGCARVAQLIR